MMAVAPLSSVDTGLAPSLPLPVLLVPALLFGMLMAAFPAGAAPMAYGSGLARPATTITFDDLPEDAEVGAFYARQGVMVSGLYVTRQFGNTLGRTTAPAAANFLGSMVNGVFSFRFSSLVSDAAFFLDTDGYGTTINATLNGAVVETLQAGSYRTDGSDFFGFTDTAFDGLTVDVSGDRLAVIDNLQFSPLTAVAVAEPGSLGVLGVGTLGVAGMGRRRRG